MTLGTTWWLYLKLRFEESENVKFFLNFFTKQESGKQMQEWDLDLTEKGGA